VSRGKAPWKSAQQRSGISSIKLLLSNFRWYRLTNERGRCMLSYVRV
jgi:hypothetical protein